MNEYTRNDSIDIKNQHRCVNYLIFKQAIIVSKKKTTTPVYFIFYIFDFLTQTIFMPKKSHYTLEAVILSR